MWTGGLFYKVWNAKPRLASMTPSVPTRNGSKSTLKCGFTQATEPVDDKVDSTLNYDLIRETILNIVSARHYDLQETLARCLFDALRALDDVQSVRIRTSKPDAYDDCETIAYQLSNL
jgi:dihydroneopterin aldolase